MELLEKVVERIATVVLVVGGIGMLIVMFLGAGDVVGTQFIGWPLPGAKEATESTMVLIVFGSLAYAQIRRQHIRVELVYTRQSPRVKAALDAVSNLVAMVFFGILCWQTFGEAVASWSVWEADVGLIRFPLYPAKSIIVLGSAVMVVQLGLHLFHGLQRLRGRETLETREEVPPAEGQVETM